MSLVKFNRRRFPWRDDRISKWFESADPFADDFFTLETDNLPAMNVKENDDRFEVELAVPGFSKEDIEISIENDLLHISAKKKKEEAEEDQEGYTRKEFSYNSFDRKLKLPTSVNQEEGIGATYRDGILRLKLVKLEETKDTPKKTIKIS